MIGLVVGWVFGMGGGVTGIGFVEVWGMEYGLIPKTCAPSG